MGGRRKYPLPGDGEGGGSGGLMMMYTTLMLILVTFFVVMVSRANFDETKYSSAVRSIQESFGPLTGGRVPAGVEEGLPDLSLGFDQGGQLVLPEVEMARIRALLAPALMSRDVRIIHSGRKRVISLSAGLVFQLDSAEIRPEMAETLAALAEVIAESGAGVDVEGHTDNAPPQTSGVGDNWDISSRRALAVMEFLNRSAEGIAPEKLRALAYAGGKPLYSNLTPQGRARNKRVDLVIDFTSARLPQTEDDGGKSYNFQGFDFNLKNDFGARP